MKGKKPLPCQGAGSAQLMTLPRLQWSWPLEITSRFHLSCKIVPYMDFEVFNLIPRVIHSPLLHNDSTVNDRPCIQGGPIR